MRALHRTALTAGLLALALVAACAQPATPPAPPAGVPAAIATQPPAATATPRPPTAAVPSPPPLKLEPIRSPFERRQLAPGEPIAQAGDVFARQGGLFFMQVATGEVDAWTLPGAPSLTVYSASPDNRWVIASLGGTTYLADRRSGATYLWETGLLAAQGDYLLLAGEERIWIAGPGQPEPKALPIEPAAPQAVISRDGQMAAVLGGGTLYLVQLESGACRAIGELAANASDPGLPPSLETTRRGETILLSTFGMEGTGPERRPVQRVERYSWQGVRLGELMPPQSGRCAFSPDGHWAAWDETLCDLVQAVVVADATTLAPRLRVVGARLCFLDYGVGKNWLADSSGLVVSTRAGYRILTLDGELTPAPTFRGSAGEPMPFSDEPLPAPDRSGLFAIGRRAVVDAASHTVAVAALDMGAELSQPADLDPWGLGSSELRFALPHLGHGGKCGEVEYVVPTEVQWAPFSAPVLAVALPMGECADLRAQPGAGGQVLACLAGGARLSLAPTAELAPLEGTLSYLTASVAWGDGLWLRVRAPDGQEGWLDVKAVQIGWAP